MTATDLISAAEAYKAFAGHRFYAYRGCAPDPDEPGRMAGNPALPLGAHHAPDVDGGEDQKARRAREDAVIEVCLSCPVMVQCDRYASSVTADGKLAEPDGVWGGRRALERHRAFIRTRHEVVAAAPDRAFQTRQRQAVLKALASYWDPYDVAAWAGVDLRTANWQRSRIVGLLSLDKATATRREVLAEAVRRGLLDAAMVVADDGTVPAVPSLLSAAPHASDPAAPVQLSFPLFFNEPMEAAA
ncbi:WhiB family transcriptional regulator [Streptomyces sp. NPDC008222]|uniref:WhiB family transcriptional regulator n=1 Tax=Streptomyces sp. NPDC008222 TaxID=3364820 RepID=UPI0036EB6F6B